MIANFLISFLKHFVIKYFSEAALERLLKVVLKQIAKTTKTPKDDEWYKAIFNEECK